MTDSPTILEQKMKILMGLRGYSIIKIDEKQALWKINSENAVTVDVSFPAELWEVKHKGKVVNDWKKDPTLPVNTRDMIQTLDDEFEAAWNEAVDNGWIIETEQPVEVPEEIEPETVQPETPKIDPEIEEKNRLEREENERILAEMDKFLQERQQAEEKTKPPEQPKQNNFKKSEPSDTIYSQPEDVLETAPTPVKGEVRLLDILSELVDDDLIQLFGKTGTCKTSIAIQAALEARSVGKSVYYLDTEKNISKKKKAEMLKAGVKYTPYTPSNPNGVFESVRDLDALHEFIKKIPKVDLIIIDSLGLPCLSVYCIGNQREQGLTLLKMMSISNTLKSYSNRNHSIGLVINQPESDMNKDQNTERRSYGDKNEFYYKELLKTAFVSKSPNKTTVVVKTFRSRDYGQGYKLFTVEISDKGVKVIQ